MIEREIGLEPFVATALSRRAHCLGRCGPLVTLYSNHTGSSDDRITCQRIRQQRHYNLGRTVGYPFIGAVMGGLGSVVFEAASVASVLDPIPGPVGGLVALVSITAVVGGLRGQTALTTLGVGTVQAVFLYGTVLETMNSRTRVRLHRILGAAFLVLGCLPVSMDRKAFGVPVPSFDVPVCQPHPEGP